MKSNGSMITLTYESTKAIPNYNVMGVCKSALEASVKYLARDLGTKQIRVNAISAGPIKTLAASAIGDAKFLYKWNEDHSFLKRNVDIHDVGNSALYLLSDLAGGVTGEIHYVDAGYNKVGMPDPKKYHLNMSKRYSGKSFKDSSVMKKAKLSLKEKKRKLKVNKSFN